MDGNQFKVISKRIFQMGCSVQEALLLAASTYSEGLSEHGDIVLEGERRINLEEIYLDREISSIDLFEIKRKEDIRFLMAAVKIVKDLERLGDHAVNIVQASQKIIENGSKRYDSIIKLSNDCREMVCDVCDSFGEKDAVKALSTLVRDSEVNELCDDIKREMILQMEEGSLSVADGVEHITIVKNWERVGDLATNIAEDVLYHLTGYDVRHSPQGDNLDSQR